MYITKEYTDTELKDLILNTLYDLFCYANLETYDKEYKRLEELTDKFYKTIKDRRVINYDNLILRIKDFKNNLEEE